MRPIDADALIETMNENAEGNWGWYGDTWQFMRDVENAPTIDAVPRWIPCEERLPKYRETVIATNRWHDGVDIVFRDAIQEDGTDDRWVFPLDDDAWCSINDFIAWMPLPEPYEGEVKDDE